jgi:hypothetical protein
MRQFLQSSRLTNPSWHNIDPFESNPEDAAHKCGMPHNRKARARIGTQRIAVRIMQTLSTAFQMNFILVRNQSRSLLLRLFQHKLIYRQLGFQFRNLDLDHCAVCVFLFLVR